MCVFNRHNAEAHLAPRKLKTDDNFNYFEDKEAMELYSRLRAQKEEIQILHGQIAAASLRELQLLNERYILERKISDLRMAIDDKQTEVITSASNELACRKGDLEQNLKLTHDLKYLPCCMTIDIATHDYVKLRMTIDVATIA
ncbi:unnamed protein product [Dovyalis caffra]|uniref:Uncharacterized protein n=1 Tax=Dovyalis caffra TaxID=77055 RepID=A0AAV1RZ19_9ROSI|nr:unnamed protein product [Dovyalis caffra]